MAVNVKISSLDPADAAALVDETIVMVIVGGVNKKTTIGELKTALQLSAQSYTHVQSSPAETWTIVHNRGANPAGVTAFDADGNQVEGVIAYTNTNLMTITFSTAISGEVVLS